MDIFYLNHQNNLPSPKQPIVRPRVSTSAERMEERKLTRNSPSASDTGGTRTGDLRRTILQKDFNFEATQTRIKSSTVVDPPRSSPTGSSPRSSLGTTPDNSVFAMFDFRKGETRFTKSKLDWQIDWEELTIEKELGRG